jgi:hypothetical protein
LEYSQVSPESLAAFWKRNKTYKVLNMINDVVLWVIWLIRNDLCFTPWIGLHVVWRKIVYLLAQWSILLQGAEKENMKMKVSSLEASSCSTTTVVAGS